MDNITVKNSMSCHGITLTRCPDVIHISVIHYGRVSTPMLLYFKILRQCRKSTCNTACIHLAKFRILFQTLPVPEHVFV